MQIQRLQTTAASIAALILLASQPARAQILYGGLVGDVTDASAAAIPNAKVTILHGASALTKS